MIEITPEMITVYRMEYFRKDDPDGVDEDMRRGLQAVAPLILAAGPRPIEAELISDPQEPHVLTTWYRAMALAIETRADFENQDDIELRAKALFPILLSPPEIPE